MFAQMDRALRATIALTLLLQALPALAAAPADVQGTGYEEAFAALIDAGVIEQGRPYAPLNRAEAVKVIVQADDTLSSRASWYSDNGELGSLFRDVRSGDWYAPYVEVAFTKGIVTGYGDGLFRPSRLLTVEEAVAMLLRSDGVRGSGGGATTSSNIQNRDNQWFTPYINAAITNNLVEERGRMLLGTTITRGQFVEMVYRLRGGNLNSDTYVTQPVQRTRTVSQTQRAGQTYTISAPQPVRPQPTPSSGLVAATRPQHASEQYFAVSIPQVGISDLTVSHPADSFSKDGVLAPLKNGVGHLFSYPGNGGKVMIYGHSSSYPWDISPFTKIFRKISELAAGDRIYLTYDRTLYVYEVTFEEAINAADTSRFQDHGTGEELILYTCWPPDSISQRYLVHAIPVQTIALR